MPISTSIVETPVRVRYAETDAAGIAHHSAFIPWLELGRVEWLRAQGIAYAALEREGYHLPVIALNLRYVAPARFDDLLIVRAGVAEARSRELLFVYEIVTDEPHARQLANGNTRHMCLFKGKISRMPESIRALADAG